MKPFLKWAGNKYRIIDKLKPHLPHGKRLIEPFTGSAAVFLNTDYPRYLLGEENPDLVNLYKILKKHRQSFIDSVRPLFSAKTNTEKQYYRLRDEFNSCEDTHRRAALFIYLNKHGYNGLCRYNQSGGFNVPFGRHIKPYFPEAELAFFMSRAKKARFVEADFQKTLNKAEVGDVVYCDPPYAPLSNTADFTHYHRHGFSEEQQKILAQKAITLANNNISVVISNHDTPFTRELYEDADIVALQVRRYISCQGERTLAPELLAVYR